MKPMYLAAIALATLAPDMQAQATQAQPRAAARPRAEHSAPAQDPGALALRNQWRGVTAYITRAAEQLTAAEYDYKPTPTVRSFGQIVAHVAGAQFTMCGAAQGEKRNDEETIEAQVKTRGDIIAALKQSTAYCEQAYAQAGAALAGAIDLYGDKATRFDALALNAVHNGEHYGNIITYMRMQGKVPPSSQR